MIEAAVDLATGLAFGLAIGTLLGFAMQWSQWYTIGFLSAVVLMVLVAAVLNPGEVVEAAFTAPLRHVGAGVGGFIGAQIGLRAGNRVLENPEIPKP